MALIPHGLLKVKVLRVCGKKGTEWKSDRQIDSHQKLEPMYLREAGVIWCTNTRDRKSVREDGMLDARMRRRKRAGRRLLERLRARPLGLRRVQKREITFLCDTESSMWTPVSQLESGLRGVGETGM